MCRRSEAAQSPRQLATAAQELTGTSRNPGVSVQQSYWVQGNAVREKGTSRREVPGKRRVQECEKVHQRREWSENGAGRGSGEGGGSGAGAWRGGTG